MKREYHKWYSPNLEKEMELLVFGHSGAKVLFFPPRMGRFFDYEDWGVIKALEEKIKEGHLQLFCIDSIDTETFYNVQDHPGHRIYRHCQYENYLLNEVFPLMHQVNNNPNVISAGCSLGAYHAVNIAMRHPNLFCKVVGMSGRYDLTVCKGYFDDLLGGYHNDFVYYHMPNQYLKNLDDGALISDIKKLDIVLVIGKNDLFLESNYELKTILDEKEISYQFHEWDGEAHRAKYWRKMVAIYI
ncbi:alpha/beta hydrolase-fold protein [Wenyingzhuangia sp. chi5]|uniref:Alpha/beta hydrolase-fold protein n=1 Tax=Wenyingzhuangia gilva TaxID=3057677 RepID=A0ABT8VN47_9FLAO|nr:alpha/beta hydrolase-fold protein [Wenyingzhuangia sp. chi5]MDO3693399.1 alpha/beta hydrolase-fold protein [Wenyingzhuangia sp. chi5]